MIRSEGVEERGEERRGEERRYVSFILFSFIFKITCLHQSNTLKCFEIL